MQCTPVRTGASSAGSQPDATCLLRLYNTLNRSDMGCYVFSYAQGQRGSG